MGPGKTKQEVLRVVRRIVQEKIHTDTWTTSKKKDGGKVL